MPMEAVSGVGFGFERLGGGPLSPIVDSVAFNVLAGDSFRQLLRSALLPFGPVGLRLDKR